MSQRTALLYELRALKARGVETDSPEWMRALHKFDQRRALNPPNNPETGRRVMERVMRDLREFLPPEPPAPAESIPEPE